MANNLFRIISESNFKTLLKNNYDNLTVALFIDNTINIGYIKSQSSLAKKYPLLKFIIINRDKFTPSTSAIFNNIDKLPSFVIYYRRQCVRIVTEKFITLPNIVDGLLNEIELVKAKLNKKEPNKNSMLDDEIKILSDENKDNKVERVIYSEEHKRKLVLLKKLHDLKKQGYTILSEYTIESNYDDMLWEYYLHTKPNEIKISPNVETDIDEYDNNDFLLDSDYQDKALDSAINERIEIIERLKEEINKITSN